MRTVRAPNPDEQYGKTAAWVRKLSRIGEIYVQDRQPFTEGSGDNWRILSWRDLRDRVEDYVQNHTLEDLKQLYRKLTDEEYAGEETKLGVVKALIKAYFNLEPAGNLTQLREIFLNRVKAEGRWGLGCPYNCGRFWMLKPTADLKGWEPEAPEHRILNGTFRCDRCGGLIQLV